MDQIDYDRISSQTLELFEPPSLKRDFDHLNDALQAARDVIGDERNGLDPNSTAAQLLHEVHTELQLRIHELSLKVESVNEAFADARRADYLLLLERFNMQFGTQA